ncbi:hypothetical protein [Paraburkholderia sp. DGU8]|uniref:hypothetical protein n=1 Tax=Paraburkholderia sp. DGU8 TaxID=3161997 RepID=UPI003466F51B
MTAKSAVYSYLRFSDPKPAGGNSADRQVEHAEGREAQPGVHFDSFGIGLVNPVQRLERLADGEPRSPKPTAWAGSRLQATDLAQ